MNKNNFIDFQIKQENVSSVRHSISEENSMNKSENGRIVDEENRSIVVGYYPFVSYQPIFFPSRIYLLKEEQIQCQRNNWSTLKRLDSFKKR